MPQFNHKETGRPALYLMSAGTYGVDDPNQVLVKSAEDMPEVDYTVLMIGLELTTKGRETMYFYFSSLVNKDVFTLWFLPSGFPDGTIDSLNLR